MRLSDLANLGQVIHTIAVVISLIYVVYQFANPEAPFKRRPSRACTNILRAGIICLPMICRAFSRRDQWTAGLRRAVGARQSKFIATVHGNPFLVTECLYGVRDYSNRPL